MMALVVDEFTAEQTEDGWTAITIGGELTDGDSFESYRVGGMSIQRMHHHDWVQDPKYPEFEACACGQVQRQCPMCGGDGGWYIRTGIEYDYFDGESCQECEATGGFLVDDDWVRIE
jgi:hypothetical protein